MTVGIYTDFIKEILLPLVAQPEVDMVSQPTSQATTTLSLPTLFVAIIVISMTVLAVYVFIKIPKTVVNSSQKAVHKTATVVAPILMQRIQHIETPIQHPIKLRRVTGWLVISIKIIIVIVPFVLVLFSRLADQKAIDYTIAVTISLWLTGLTLLAFVAQYTVARLLAVRRQDLL